MKRLNESENERRFADVENELDEKYKKKNQEALGLLERVKEAIVDTMDRNRIKRQEKYGDGGTEISLAE